MLLSTPQCPDGPLRRMASLSGHSAGGQGTVVHGEETCNPGVESTFALTPI